MFPLSINVVKKFTIHKKEAAVNLVFFYAISQGLLAWVIFFLFMSLYC